MGCTQSVQAEKEKRLSPYKQNNKGQMSLDVRLKWVRISMEQHKIKLNANLQKNIVQLTSLIKQTRKQRNPHIQYQKVEQCTWKKNQAHIYEVIISYLKVLQEYKNLLRNPETMSELKGPILRIIYAKDAISNDSLQQLCSLILARYPQLKEILTKETDKIGKIINDEIINHHRNERTPNNKMVNDFILEFCSAFEFDLQIVNASGNSFHYV